MVNQVPEIDWPDDDALWYKDAILYELHVRAFYDNNGDGIGDFRGLAEKLDYLQDLGVTAIWLLPFYPSPLRDDGYDIADYTGVHPAYGTLADFKAFLREAHSRGLHVITELVLNHTSDQHPWFQRARQAPPGSRWRNFYVWSDTPNKYKDTRIIFKDFESSNWAWDPVAKAYYWHRFYSHQPDLNFASPDVRQAILRVVNFWLKMGVSGLRLDAVPYLYKREGTNCENLPETHVFLKELRRYVDEHFKNRMLLAEANQWPEDAVAYFGDGDESHMAYHFPLMPRLFMAIGMEERFPIVDILQQTPSIPENAQWALFLRNHDELTLEMVTDEEREYMYRVYAPDQRARLNLGIRRRLAPLLNNDRKKIELMNGLLFSLPGSPVIYYGDEIGMGDNYCLDDRNGVRTPMHWSADRNAGFSTANPQQLYLPVLVKSEYHYEAVNVETQQNNPDSLLWWMKRLIAQRKRLKAFGHGSLEFLHPENRKVLTFVRRYRDETILVVANLSRLTQYCYLNLSQFVGKVPCELFGHSEFPTIGQEPYCVTLGPYGFYWFSLELPESKVAALHVTPSETAVPTLIVAEEWADLFKLRTRPMLEAALLGYIRQRRWYTGKARRSCSLQLVDVIPVSYSGTFAYLLLARIDYTEGEAETYLLPVTFASGERARQVRGESPQAVVARLKLAGEGGGSEGIIYDALIERDFCNVLLEAIARRHHFKGKDGEVTASPTRVFRKLRGPVTESLSPALLKVEQTHTSVVYGEKLMLKLLRRLEAGVSPELEIGRFLTEKTAYANIPSLAGVLRYQASRGGEPATLGLLYGYVPNLGDAWQYTQDSIRQYFERVLARPGVPASLPAGNSFLNVSDESIPELAKETIGHYLASARLLGKRTAELHLALASAIDDPGFAPEPFSVANQYSLYHHMRGFTRQVFELLRRRIGELPDEVKTEARRVLGLEEAIISRYQNITKMKIEAMRIRCHGDYHLGQVLYTGNDFVFVDFEGEPMRSLGERRLKRLPFWDVAGMIRSFHYAAYSTLLGQLPTVLRPEDIPVLEPWAKTWYLWVSAVFVNSYLQTMGDAPLLPKNHDQLKTLMYAYLLEKAVYEVNYELNNRPAWVKLPLRGILEILESG